MVISAVANAVGFRGATVAVGETDDKLCFGSPLSLISRAFYDIGNDFSLEN